MKKIKIHTKPEVKTTLPHHEQEARRARAKAERPSVSRNPRRRATATPRADFSTNPLLFGQ